MKLLLFALFALFGEKENNNKNNNKITIIKKITKKLING